MDSLLRALLLALRHEHELAVPLVIRRTHRELQEELCGRRGIDFENDMHASVLLQESLHVFGSHDMLRATYEMLFS